MSRRDDPPTDLPFRGAVALATAASCRDADRRATSDYAIPSLLLMERAGLGAADEILRRRPSPGRAVVVAGPGNNGADGLVVARRLHEAGWGVTISAPAGRPATPDGIIQAAIVERLGVPTAGLAEITTDADDVVVDALLGTGAGGELRPAIADGVRWINASPGFVVALDVPTGVDADSGRVAGTAVRAALTLTFHRAKPGLHITPGRDQAGSVVRIPIGIPDAAAGEVAAWLTCPEAVASVPARESADDKYAAGAALVVAGSPGMVGAAALAARGAMRAGAGLVVAAVPAGLLATLTAIVPEAVGAALPDVDGALGTSALDAVARQFGRVSAIAVGPGLGRAPETGDLVRALLERVVTPLVLDADALWHLTTADLRGRSRATVLTPHAGEAARLLGISRAEVEAGRLDAARGLCEHSGAVVVLKGPGTLIAAPDGRLAVDGVGGPALATAGSGDVLTGVVTALLARGCEPWLAAVCAVAAHGNAARLAGRGTGTVAMDVAEALPGALAST